MYFWLILACSSSGVRVARSRMPQFISFNGQTEDNILGIAYDA